VLIFELSAPIAVVSVVAGAGAIIVLVVSTVVVVVSVVLSLVLPPQAAAKAPIAKTNKSFFIVVNVFVSEFEG
jgi:hypothetical protein